MTPLQPKRLEKLARIVGPITTDQLAAVPGNMASLEISVPNGRLLGGLRDALPAGEANDAIGSRFIPWLKLRTMISGYVGYQGDPSFLGVLDLMFRRPGRRERLQAEYYRPLAAAIWAVCLFSFQPEVMADRGRAIAL